jgi:hypothetical protein
MTTLELFRQSDNARIKALVKDLPKVNDRTMMLVHSDIFQKSIEQSKINLN